MSQKPTEQEVGTEPPVAHCTASWTVACPTSTMLQVRGGGHCWAHVHFLDCMCLPDLPNFVSEVTESPCKASKTGQHEGHLYWALDVG